MTLHTFSPQFFSFTLHCFFIISSLSSTGGRTQIQDRDYIFDHRYPYDSFLEEADDLHSPIFLFLQLFRYHDSKLYVTVNINQTSLFEAADATHIPNSRMLPFILITVSLKHGNGSYFQLYILLSGFEKNNGRQQLFKLKYRCTHDDARTDTQS